MDVDRLILEFERKLVLQRYSANSIANYKSSARSFLDLAKRKFSHPAEIDELAVEKYVLWKIERHRQFSPAHDSGVDRQVLQVDLWQGVKDKTPLSVEEDLCVAQLSEYR